MSLSVVLIDHHEDGTVTSQRWDVDDEYALRMCRELGEPTLSAFLSSSNLADAATLSERVLVYEAPA